MQRLAGGRQARKLALVLCGGGFTGYLFEVGALAALDDLFDEGMTTNDFDIYLGESAGAALSALVANGVKPEQLLEANLSGSRPYCIERRDIFAPALGEGFKTGFRALRQLYPLLKLYYQNRHEMSLIDLLDKAQDALPSGIYTLEPFARYLEATFKAKGLSNSFGRLHKELYIPATDLETGQSVVFGSKGWRKVPLAQAVAASSAAPVYFCPVRVGGRDYVDAGVGQPGFFKLAIEKGANMVVIINPTVPIPFDLNGRPNGKRNGRSVRVRDKGVLSVEGQASRISSWIRFSQALELAQRDYPDVEFFLVSPSRTETLLTERSFLSFRDRVHLLRCGYRSVIEAVKGQASAVRERFGRHRIDVSPAKLQKQMRLRMVRLNGESEKGSGVFSRS